MASQSGGFAALPLCLMFSLLVRGLAADPPPTDPPAEPSKGVASKLHDIYSMIPQDGFKILSRDFVIDKSKKRKYKEPYGKDLDKIAANVKSGASDAFLVEADSLTVAIAQSRILLGDLDTPAVTIAKRGEYWAVAHLGMGEPEGRSWVMETVERRGNTLRIVYREAAGKDSRVLPYLYWISIGPLERGPFFIELIDFKSKEIMFRRRRDIP